MMKNPTFFVIVIIIFILVVSQFSWVQPFGNYYSISTNQEYKLLFDSSSTSTSNIREWGCNRTETPFIFVHIHKAGGGSVKARISASSLNYTKESPRGVDGSYYPIFADNNNNNNDTTMKKARLCWSCFSHRRPSNETAYELTLLCHASTPIGRAIGCPIPIQKIRTVADGRNIEDCRADSDTCRIVYVGHNLFGSELHWLPARFLKKWWINTMTTTTSAALPSQVLSSQVNTNTNTTTDSMLLSLWDRLQQPTKPSKTTKNFHNNNIWCSTNNKNLSRPQSIHHYNRFYKECSLPLQRQVDKAAIEAVVPFIGRGSTTTSTKGRQKKQQQQQQQQQYYGGGGEVQSWSAIYASLPVLRVTMVREPFSWLVSKFIWHKANIHDGLQPHRDLECDNIEAAIIPNFTRPQKLHSRTTIPGWLTRMSLEYLMWLCGEDCIVRYWKGESTLEDLQKQAEDNLRYGLAVVGLLESGDDMFYEMLSARVQYIDTSLNPDVHGGLHSTRSLAGTCKDKFTKDKEFQQKLLSLSPELRVINHLYQVAVEVNRFQLNELRSCSNRMDSFLSNRTESNRTEPHT